MEDVASPSQPEVPNVVRMMFSNDYVPRSTSYNLDVYELDETSPHTPAPQGCQIALKPHQETLLHRCIEYENEKLKLNTFPRISRMVASDDQTVKLNMGILADRVGSGKSYVILALLKSNDITSRTTHVVKSFGMNGMIFEAMDNLHSLKTNVLVIPHNIPSQWEAYVRDFGCDIKYLLINKNKMIRAIEEETIKVEEYDLIIVTSTFYKHFAAYAREKNHKFQRLIFDEIDNVVITGCNRINAMFYWFVTASYGNLLYPKGFNSYDRAMHRYISFAEGMRTPGFVRTIFCELADILPKELMKLLIVKNTEAYVQSSLQLPPIVNYTIRCMTPAPIRILNGIVDTNIINALNAGDVEGAINFVSPTNRNTESHIIDIMISRYNKELKNLNIRLRMTDELAYDNESERQETMATIQRRINEIKQKINQIEVRIKSNDVCCICYDNIDNKTVMDCCQNSFCFKCINLWMVRQPMCPMCKSPITRKSLYVISEHDEGGASTSSSQPSQPIAEDIFNPEYTKQYDKNENLKRILRRRLADPNFKCLLFSCYDHSFVNVIPVLESLRIKWSYMKGRGDVIKSTVQKYKNGDLQVLLINVHDYGSGLNLENTSDIIMFHKFDSEIEKQVIGRAHRLGRSGSLSVWYLLHENEVTTASSSH